MSRSLQNLRGRGSQLLLRLKTAVRQIACLPLWGRSLRILAPKRRRTNPRSASVPRVLVVNLIPFLGDLILYLPLVDALRAANPQAEITFMGTASTAPILEQYPGIDHVLTLPVLPRTWVDSVPVLRDYRRFAGMARFCRSIAGHEQFDMALIPRGGADPFFSAHAAWLMGVPRIYGYSSALEPERAFMQTGSDALMTDKVRSKGHLHESMRAVEVAAVAGLLRSDCGHEQQAVAGLTKLAYAQEVPLAAGLSPDGSRRPYAVVAAGAGALRRQWPPERFRQIAVRLNRELGMTVLVTGSSAEAPLAAAISQGDPEIRDLCGKLTLLQLICLMSRAALFVGNDSGPGHMAGALGVPTVSLNAYAASGPVDHHQSPARNQPVGPRVAVVRPQHFLPPCADECVAPALHCLSQIQPEEVWRAVLAVLQTSGLKNLPATGCRVPNGANE